MDLQEKNEIIDSMSDENLLELAGMITPWSSSSRVNDERVTDEDGFSVSTVGDNGDYAGLSELQTECWNKFQKNPQISSHIQDFMGDLTGSGFAWGSQEQRVQEVIEEISEDPRNELYLKLPKYVGRSEIEGELFLSFSLHHNGFVEIDFMEPSDLIGGENNTGIYFHPRKRSMPMFYEFFVSSSTEIKESRLKKNAAGKINFQKKETSSILIPSIYVAYYPELGIETISHFKLDAAKLAGSQRKKYEKLGGFFRFIVSWDRGLMTQRNVSHIRTTLSWINHYENLKKWEIDHKKSAGSYLWVVSMEDAKAFRTWIKMTDDERASTGLTAKKTPGGTLICPPGISIECKNPSLPNISEQDTDILHMITSGLNKPEDMVTGQTKGDTFSGVKASRGPQSDRVYDNIQYFENFLRYVFWRGIFYLKSVKTGFKMQYRITEVTEFKNKKPVERKVVKQVYDLIDFEFPTPEISDLSSKATAYLGSKHLSVVESLGIERAEIAKRLGFRNYGIRRKRFETENNTYPDLPLAGEIDAAQESGGEAKNVNPGLGRNKKEDG